MDTMSSSDDEVICLGAEAIARDIFKNKLTRRQVYRLAGEGGWPIFRLRGKWAARPAAMRAETTRRETMAAAHQAPEAA